MPAKNSQPLRHTGAAGAQPTPRPAPRALRSALSAITREIGYSTGNVCDRLSVEIRYTMPVFADEILRRKS
ncbi:MAG: hypothetical protein HGA45_10705 [Chloroflexales bacterium]|nr:hypothetical protein [Chloroflexales bacterium]